MLVLMRTERCDGTAASIGDGGGRRLCTMAELGAGEAEREAAAAERRGDSAACLLRER